MTKTLLLVLASVSIALLSAYAIYLQLKLRGKRQQQAQLKQQIEVQLTQFKYDTREDIRFIAQAMLEQQCELTEGVIRIYHLLTRIDLDAWHTNELEHTRNYYHICAQMPILEDYKQQSKQQKRQQDRQRNKLEQQHQQAVLTEMQWLKNYITAE